MQGKNGGRSYFLLNDFEKAEEYYKQGLKLAPLVVEDNWELVIIYINFKKFDFFC